MSASRVSRVSRVSPQGPDPTVTIRSMGDREERQAATEVLRRLLAAVEAGEVSDARARHIVRRLEGAAVALEAADRTDRPESRPS